MTNNSCIFCKIVADPSQSEVVWNDDVVLAFMDISPATDGHLLVIPREHHTALTDLPADTAAHMMRVGQRLAQSLKASELRTGGINLMMSEGKVAFQEIFHSHLHVIPRHEGDGFVIQRATEAHEAKSLAQSAQAVRAALSTAQD